MSRDDEEGFLGRWSKRKRQAVRAVPDEPLAEAEPTAQEEAEPEVEAATETDAEILARLDLPDPDTLVQGDDFSRFLKAPLPVHLKRRALRRLWVSNPVLANLDGLNDYDTDFTGDTVAKGLLKTAYKVGSGFLDQLVEQPVEKDVMHAGVERPLGADADDDAHAFADAAQSADDETVACSDDRDDGPHEIQNSAESPEEPQEFASVRTNRRMSFRFDG